jgi:hypothetical protein
MNGVATKIAEKVSVFFEDERVHSGTSEKKSQDDASGAATHDATSGVPLLRQ